MQLHRSLGLQHMNLGWGGGGHNSVHTTLGAFKERFELNIFFKCLRTLGFINFIFNLSVLF